MSAVLNSNYHYWQNVTYYLGPQEFVLAVYTCKPIIWTMEDVARIAYDLGIGKVDINALIEKNDAL